MSGTLFGLGVGPGDPELLTLKALRILQAVPVIAYPQLGETPSLAREIVAPHLAGAQREITVRVPLGDHGLTAAAYDAAAAEIAATLEAGQDVAAICEGDAFFYGSFVYLWSRLADWYACEIVPGVSSLVAGPARAGLPLVTGDEVLAVLPATLPDEALEARLATADSAVLVKLGRHLPRIAALLDRLGLTERTHYVERATFDDERSLPLANVGAGGAPYFSMLVVRRRQGAPR